jgi:hypothetical protein
VSDVLPLLKAALRVAAVHLFFRGRCELVQQHVVFHPEALAPGDFGPGAAELRVVRLPVFGRDPAGVIAVGKERSAPRCAVTVV